MRTASSNNSIAIKIKFNIKQVREIRQLEGNWAILTSEGCIKWSICKWFLEIVKWQRNLNWMS